MRLIALLILVVVHGSAAFAQPASPVELKPPIIQLKPHPKQYLSGCLSTVGRRSKRLLKDPLVLFFPVAHPLLASKYLEKHGYSAALGLGIMGASSVAAARK